jgi:hypothetical protein
VAQGVKLTTHDYPVSRLKTRGNQFPLPHMWCDVQMREEINFVISQVDAVHFN